MEEIKSYSKNLIYNIVYNDKLCLKNESQLYLFIKELILESDEYYSLFENLSFSNLSNDDISDFISTFNIEHLTMNIWQQICKYFTLYHSSICKNAFYSEKIDRYYDPNEKYLFTDECKQKMNGIISYLTKKYSGNIKNIGIII
ncbi:hypothetical protein TRFO_29056 [Tritrichomonas foetus]|uniref:Uncharacterized protein n=1 Tax=Tritrichomonas foetus TaxID=1144522 RepID=A0A1J4K1C8_9EUKA|nr:hypothetical protein TRFO_29056 [Tritrichomonas foetus]|eukprot:OHT03558.1 hypothetical protein TRFO_29056 [Tritrichomonas foetus]